MQQIVSRAVVSTEIVDILEAAGLETPDIAILSDEFLAEIQGMEKSNLALEALRKLITGEIRSHNQVNVVQMRAFSERLEEAINRYHTNAITTAQVIQELIALAKDIRAANDRGEEVGLSHEEIAFYDALAENDSAVEVMGNDHLARDLTRTVARPEKQRLRRLATSGAGKSPDARTGEAYSPQARVSTGPAGRRRQDRPATSRSTRGEVGGLTLMGSVRVP